MKGVNFVQLTTFVLVLIMSFPTVLSSPAIAASTLYSNSKEGNIKRNRHLTEKCKAGKIYQIKKIDDLFENLSNLECIFRAAEEPTKVPEGAMYGDIFTLGNTRFLNPIIRQLWAGKFTKKIICNGSETYIGWNKVFGDVHLPFVSYLGKKSDSLNPHRLYNDNKKSIIIDYRRDMSVICPDFLEILEKNPENLPIQKPLWNKTFFPINAMLDILRFVGRQEDGGAIFLGQLFFQDIFRTDEMAKPISFFSVVNYDSDVNPEFKSGQALQPLEADFSYRNQNLLDAFMILLPLDNLFTEPLHTTKVVANEVVSSCRNFGNFFVDVCFGGGSSDARRLSDIFISSLPNSTSSFIDSDDKLKSIFLSKQEAVHSHLNEL